MRAAATAVILFCQILAFGQADQQITDLKLLMGKSVVAQRIPLFQPGTFNNIPLSYAGQHAIVIGVKLAAGIPISKSLIARMKPDQRATLLDMQNRATITVQFEDGTKADTGGGILPSQLGNYFELAPGQALETIKSTAVDKGTVANAGVQTCPVRILKVSSSGGSFGLTLMRSLENKPMNGHYLETQWLNESGKEIKAIESGTEYIDVMGDRSVGSLLVSQNSKPIKPGETHRGYSEDVIDRLVNGKGEVTVWVSRIRFIDDTFWSDNGSHSCFLTSKIKE
jgi:hypothetical protein